MVYVMPRAVWRVIANLLTVTSTGLFDGAKLRLFTNDIVPTPTSVLADFTEATFTGYTAGGLVVTWGTAFIGADGNIHLASPGEQFEAGSGLTVSETITGAYLVGDPAGTPFLIGAEKFDSPVQITAPFDGLVVDVDLVMSSAA